MKFKLISLAVMLSTTNAFAGDMPPNTFADSQVPLQAPPQQLSASQDIADKVQLLNDLQFTPQQSQLVKDLLLEQKRNASSPYTTTSVPVTRSVGVTLNPGETPPILRLSAGMLSTVVFSDSSGNAWNIEKVNLDRARFNDGVNVDGKDSNEGIPETNVLTIEPLDPVAFGNVAVTLKGLNTPVIFMLTVGQRDVDVRVDARLPGRSPDAKTMVSTGGMIAPDNVSLTFMDGLAPEGAIEMTTNDSGVRAWKYGGFIFVRSQNTVIQPAFLSSFRANNGMQIFRYEDSENLKYITFSKGGIPKTVYLEDNF